MTEHPAAPTTEAGRRLWAQPKYAENESWDAWTTAIIAVEAEARAAARKEVLDEIRARLHPVYDGKDFDFIRAILDSLSTDTREEPTDA